MKTQLKKGTLEMCVLALLEKADSYAYIPIVAGGTRQPS